MIPEKQIKEIQNYLQKSENPLIFFDDDLDGLASYLLLIKKYDKGYGIPLKTGPVFDKKYLHYIEENSPDLIVVLDKSDISQDMIEHIHVPIIWIDHHPIQNRKGVHYYNSLLHSKEPECTTEIAYEIVKSNEWIALAGAISDWRVPYFYEDYKQNNPNLFSKSTRPEKLLFESDFGKVIKKMSLLLKGKTSAVRKQITTLTKLESPQELLENETSRAKYLNKTTEKLEKEYNSLLSIAKKLCDKEESILVYTYPSTKNSHTAMLSNELLYNFPNKLIIVGREKGDEIKMSLRSNKYSLPKLISNALINVKGYGGGHQSASGAVVSRNDFERFLSNIKDQL